MFPKALLDLFNYVYHNGAYPQIWSEGIINPIFKTGKMTMPENYRKITLLSSIGKLFDSILNNRLCFCKEVLQSENHGKMGSNAAHILLTTCLYSTVLSKNIRPRNALYTCVSSILNRHSIILIDTLSFVNWYPRATTEGSWK